MTACTREGCEREARMAVRTTCPARTGWQSTVYYDDRGAPKAALRYCKAHGVELVAELAQALVATDDV